MTYLRTVPSGLDHKAFQPPRYGALVPLVGTALFATLGLVVALPRCWRQAVEARRARHHLMQLDDHLLRDIGLNRIEVRLGNVTALAERRKSLRN